MSSNSNDTWRIEKSLDVNAPLEACYRVWRKFEEYPRFMAKLECIRQKGDPDVWHWEVIGPDGSILEWDAEVKGLRHDNTIISWRTVRNADVPHSGAITLHPLEENSTRIHFVVEYSPLSGILMDFGEDLDVYAQTSIEESLQEYKNLVEKEAGVSLRRK